MVALGLVLLVLSGALAIGVALSNTDPVSASAFGAVWARFRPRDSIRS